MVDQITMEMGIGEIIEIRILIKTETLIKAIIITIIINKEMESQI